MNSSSLQCEIAATLRNIGTPECLAEAIRIETLTTLKRRFHFRGLNLSISNLKTLLDTLNQEQGYKVNSISFSHNSIGDQGAILLANRLPNYVEEIGLVDCGISDVGGQAILDRLNELPHLDMLCIEQNNLSESLKLKYHKFAAFNPDLMIII